MNFASSILCIFSGLGIRAVIDQEIEKAGVHSDCFQELSGKMAKFLFLSKSDNTSKKYAYYFNKWETFICSKGGCALPASPVHVALYITHLMDIHTSYSVISTTVYSIKWAHSLRSLSDPTDNTFVTNLLESAKRLLSKPVSKKQPVTTDMLIELCSLYTDSSDVIVVRDLCMILIGFTAFLRFDELSKIRCKDIKIYENYFSIFIHSSKTDQYRCGNEVVISKGNSVACPYNMLLRYLSISNQSTQDDRFLFRPCFRSGSMCKLIYKDKPLSYTRSRECLLDRLRLVSGDLNIGLHSLRSGGATSAANAGVNDRCWKRHGRWKSDNSKDGYVEDSLDSRLSVSKTLGL